MSSLSEKIKAWAYEVGFDRAGIARAEYLAKEASHLFRWLDAGHHGEMAWMDRWREKRVDPSELLPNAGSVVAVALNYFTPHEHIDSAGSGKISRYAWGVDYHDVLKEKAYQLLDRIQREVPGVSGRVCLDTAPMMDKAWAVRAGLGWIGKSSNLITTDLGSWVFLGEIVLDVELDYDDEVVPDHCGSCSACVDACPTGAITEPYVVDARRCISYATIELRDEALPAEFDGKLDGWLYGCDVCQDVCPWNRFEKPSADERFQPRNGETSIDHESVLELTPDRFASRFRRSAIKRTKLSGLKRNARYLNSYSE
jgi:epoxyqueuosine reductase